MGEIFQELGQVSVPISNLVEEYIRLFDETEKAIHSVVNAADNKIDHLKKIIDEVVKDMEKDPSKPTDDQPLIDPPNNSSVFQGEGSSVSNTTELSTEGENPTPTEGEHLETEKGFASPFEGENENSNDEGDLSEFEEEVNAELDPVYDPNYPPLTIGLRIIL